MIKYWIDRKLKVIECDPWAVKTAKCRDSKLVWKSIAAKPINRVAEQLPVGRTYNVSNELIRYWHTKRSLSIKD